LKKVLIGILFFGIGVVLSLALSSFFRNLIIDLYKITTNNGIQFYGKGFFLFFSSQYYILFGLAFLFFGVINWQSNLKKVLISFLFLVLLFSISLIAICAFDANLKIITCTMCDDGIFKINRNGINYETIILISLVIGLIPSLVKSIRKVK